MMASSATIKNGTLFVVASPIGNKSDITQRAVETLKFVDIILAEDTRHTLPLLNALGIKKPLQSLHEYNEKDKAGDIITNLLSGINYALLSDAGTPLISDPGYLLVKLARAQHVNVVPIPGACAFITALQGAGVPCDVVSFFGFLPAKSAARLIKLREYQNIYHTLVFYESTHRIKNCLLDIASIFGEDCDIVLVKELTKAFEKFIFGNPQEVVAWLDDDVKNKNGEFVVIIPQRKLKDAEDDSEATLQILLEELPLKQAVKIATKILNKPKNELYKIALKMGA